MKMNLNILSTTLFVALAMSFSVSLQAQSENGYRDIDGGVKARTLSPGAGPAAEEGMLATIHFVGWIDDGGNRGREFFNSRRQGKATTFVIGTDKVMPAWNAGVKGMQVGERRMLLIPPAMGYGNRGVEGEIPPRSSLMMQVELIALESGN